MNTTDVLVQRMNGILKMKGQPELQEPPNESYSGELGLLRLIRKTYTARLLENEPRYRNYSPEKIPDMFLMALKHREAELLPGKSVLEISSTA